MNFTEARDLLDRKLKDGGYIDAHDEQYLRPKYKLVDLHFYRVHDGFPRLTRDQIPSGVGDVHYDVTLAACQEFKIDENMVVLRLRKIVE